MESRGDKRIIKCQKVSSKGFHFKMGAEAAELTGEDQMLFKNPKSRGACAFGFFPLTAGFDFTG